MRAPSFRTSKPSTKGQNLGVGRWGARQVLGFCSVLAIVSVPTSVLIGSFMGGRDEVLVALAISAVFVPLFGSIALAFVALGWFAEAMRDLGRRAAGPSNLRTGGVSDEWLDGPA